MKLSTRSTTYTDKPTESFINAIQGPCALAFDANGNLWSSNAGAPFTLVEFAQANLGVSGAPAPAITISPTMVGGIASLNAPNGLCFDTLGGLAAADSADAFGVPCTRRINCSRAAPPCQTPSLPEQRAR